jgi:endonuclease/exonuclease/phosphatase (EEP) superfamily protein YafD
MKWLFALPILGTLLSLSRRAHWIFRVWDFPRLQIAAAAAVSAAVTARGKHRDPLLAAGNTAVVAWQLFRIHRYTPLTRPTVKRAGTERPDDRITLMMTNVLQQNRQYQRLLDLVGRVQPDVILAVEIDDDWMRAIEPLRREYPHTVLRPLDNFYGMTLFSRLPLIDPRVDFLVQDDIPSIHTRIRLRSGVEVVLHGLHPRPPEPIRDQPSSPRDAELVLMGRAIAEQSDEPTIVAGDLNDVAWSSTSELFVRLSGLLDPRVGRGLYNSFNAKNPLFRYPLDHVFHSTHFKLVRLQRLPPIGSDHFPILVELQYEPEATEQQEPSHERPGDGKLASDKLEQERHDKATGADRPRE